MMLKKQTIEKDEASRSRKKKPKIMFLPKGKWKYYQQRHYHHFSEQ